MEIEQSNDKSDSSEAEVKKDNRFVKHQFILGVVSLIAVLSAFVKFGSTGAIVAALLAFASHVLTIALAVSFYRCPACRKPLDAENSGTMLNKPLRFHCPDCDIIWDAGVKLGSTGD